MRSVGLLCLLALGACKKEEPAPPPRPTPIPDPIPDPIPKPDPTPTPVADAAPVAGSVVLFEAVMVNLAPKGEPYQAGSVLVPKACWDAAKRVFAVGGACGSLAPEGGVVAQLEAPQVTAALGGAGQVAPYEGVMGVRATVGKLINRGAIWPADAYQAVWGTEFVKDVPDLGYDERKALAAKLGVPGEPHADFYEVSLDGNAGVARLLELHVDQDRDEEDNLTSIGNSGLYIASPAEPGWTPLFTSQTHDLWPVFVDLDRNGRAELWLELESETDNSRSHVLMRVENGSPVELGRFDASRIH